MSALHAPHDEYDYPHTDIWCREFTPRPRAGRATPPPSVATTEAAPPQAPRSASLETRLASLEAQVRTLTALIRSLTESRARRARRSGAYEGAEE